MAAQKGRSFLAKRGDAASPEVFTTVGAFRTNTLTINKETVDVTTKDDTDLWRARIANAGLRDMRLSGGGVFKNSTQEKNVRSDIFGSILHNYQMVVPGLGTFEGPFDITNLEYSGDHDDAVMFQCTWESAGTIAFTAA